MRFGKEVQLSVFSDDMILCMENPEESMNKALKLIYQPSKAPELHDQYTKISMISIDLV